MNASACEWCGCAGSETHDCYEGCGECRPCRATSIHDRLHDLNDETCGPFCTIAIMEDPEAATAPIQNYQPAVRHSILQ